jgi:hypothetical protein
LKSTAASLRNNFQDFLNSSDTLQIYLEGKLVFSSTKDRVIPLLEYIDRLNPESGLGPSIIFDRIMGNAAALLSVKAGAVEVFSPLGSRLGIETLDKYRIKYHFNKTVPFIKKDDSEDMCFMEKLSTGKTPDEFYPAVKQIIK